eukprot:5505037-Pleurochrysis_carterae.AAC.1
MPILLLHWQPCSAAQTLSGALSPGRLPVGDNLADDSLHLEYFLLLLGPLVGHVGAQPAPALPASESHAALNAAVVDAGVAFLEVVCVLLDLEEQRLQLQH